MGGFLFLGCCCLYLADANRLLWVCLLRPLVDCGGLRRFSYVVGGDEDLWWVRLSPPPFFALYAKKIMCNYFLYKIGNNTVGSRSNLHGAGI